MKSNTFKTMWWQTWVNPSSVHSPHYPHRSTTMEWSPSTFRWVSSRPRLSRSVTAGPSLPPYGLTCITAFVVTCTTASPWTKRSLREPLRTSESISRIWCPSPPPGPSSLPGLRSRFTEAARRRRWEMHHVVFDPCWHSAYCINNHCCFTGKYISGSVDLRWPFLFCYV